MKFPARTEYHDYYHTYIKILPEANPITLLEKAQEHTLKVIESIPTDLYDYRYAEGKWTIKEVLIHLTDCEQILSYRALRFARQDFQSALPFDENDYVRALGTTTLSWDYLVSSTKLLRAQTIHLFKGFTAEESQRGGSEAFPNTVQAVACIIAAHQLHHISVLEERYLKQAVTPFVV